MHQPERARVRKRLSESEGDRHFVCVSAQCARETATYQDWKRLNDRERERRRDKARQRARVRKRERERQTERE